MKNTNIKILKDRQYYKFCAYGFLRNLRFFEAFLILFLLDRGFSFTSIGILYAIREISANILEIPSGITADVLGRKKTLSTSFIAYIISFLLLFSFHNFTLYTVAFFFYGVGEAFRSGTHKGMIADYLKSKNKQDQMINYYGHTRSWSQFGLAVSSIIAGFIVFYSGSYNGIFLFSAFPYILNLLLILSYPDYLDRSDRSDRSGKGRKRDHFSNVLKDSIKTIKNTKVLNLLNVSALHTAYLKAMKDYIQPMLLALVLLIPAFVEKNDEERSAVFIGIIYFFIFVLTSLASVYSGRLSKSGLKNIPIFTLLAGLISGVLSGLFYMMNLPLIAVLFFVIIYMIENLRKPVLTGYLSENVDNSILTSVLSVQSQIKTVFTAIIALLFGIIADQTGIGWSLVLISTALFLFTLIIKIITRTKG